MPGPMAKVPSVSRGVLPHLMVLQLVLLSWLVPAKPLASIPKSSLKLVWLPGKLFTGTLVPTNLPAWICSSPILLLCALTIATTSVSCTRIVSPVPLKLLALGAKPQAPAFSPPILIPMLALLCFMTTALARSPTILAHLAWLTPTPVDGAALKLVALVTMARLAVPLEANAKLLTGALINASSKLAILLASEANVSAENANALALTVALLATSLKDAMEFLDLVK